MTTLLLRVTETGCDIAFEPAADGMDLTIDAIKVKASGGQQGLSVDLAAGAHFALAKEFLAPGGARLKTAAELQAFLDAADEDLRVKLSRELAALRRQYKDIVLTDAGAANFADAALPFTAGAALAWRAELDLERLLGLGGDTNAAAPVVAIAVTGAITLRCAAPAVSCAARLSVGVAFFLNGSDLSLPHLALDLPELGWQLPRLRWPTLQFATLDMPDGAFMPNLALPKLPAFPLTLEVLQAPALKFTVTNGTLDISTAAAQKGKFSLGWNGTPILTVTDAALAFSNGELALGGVLVLADIDLPTTGPRAVGPLLVTLDQAKLENCRLSWTSGAAPQFSATLKLGQVTVAVVDEPDTRLVLSLELNIDGQGISIGGGELIEPSPLQLLQAAAGAASRAIALDLSAIDPSGFQKILQVLSRILAALSRSAGSLAQGLADSLTGIARAVQALFERLLATLANAAPDGMVVHLLLEPGSWRPRQLLLSFPKLSEAGEHALVEGGFLSVAVSKNVVPSLLFDFGPGAFGMALLATWPDSDADSALFSLSTDLWLSADERGTQAANGPVAATPGAAAARQPALAIKVKTRPSASNSTSVMVVGLMDGKVEVFRRLAAPPSSANGRPPFRFDAPLRPGAHLDADDFTLAISANKEALFPFLAKTGASTGGAPPGGSLFDQLTQKIKIGDVGNARIAGDKFICDTAITMVLDEAEASATIELTLELATLHASLRGGEQIAINGPLAVKPMGSFLGLTMEVVGKQQEKADAAGNPVYAYFALGVGGAPSLGLAKGASIRLTYAAIASPGSRGLVFIVSEFAVSRSGVDLKADVSPDDAVTLAGLETAFRFDSGQLVIHAGQLQGFSVSGHGALPPALVGDAKASISLRFGADPDGSVRLQSGTAVLDKSGDPIECHSTRFAFAITELGLDFRREGGVEHFFFLLSGSARFSPGPGEFGSGLLQNLGGIEIVLDKAPLTGNPAVLARHIKFVVALPEKKKFNLFKVFSFEVRSIGFEPSSAVFGGAAALVIGGKISFAESGDAVKTSISFHAMYIGAPSGDNPLPRIHFEGLALELALGSAVKIAGTVAAIERQAPGAPRSSLMRPAGLPEGFDNVDGFLGEGTITIQGLPEIACAMGYLEIVPPDEPDNIKRAFFIYIERRGLSYQIPVINFFVREIGAGFGYRYTLAALGEADHATSPNDLIARLSRVVALKSDLAKLSAWSVDLEGRGEPARFSLALRAMVSQLSATPGQPLVYDAEREKTLQNLFLFEWIGVMRSDLTVLVAAKAWLGVNYDEFRNNRDEIGARPVALGYLYLSLPRREFLARLESGSNPYFSESATSKLLPPVLMEALRNGRWSATLYVRPGLFHFELGWPDQLGYQGSFGPLQVSFKAGLIFRVHEDALLLGANFEAGGSLALSAGIGGGGFGVSVSANAQVHLAMRLIAYLDTRDFANSLYYGLQSFDASIEFSLSAWLRVGSGWFSFTLSVSFSVRLQIGAAVELALTPASIGARARCYVSVSVFGRGIGIAVNVALNAGMVDQARLRVARFMDLGLNLPLPESSSVAPPNSPAGAHPADAARQEIASAGAEIAAPPAVPATPLPGPQPAPTPTQIDPLRAQRPARFDLLLADAGAAGQPWRVVSFVPAALDGAGGYSYADHSEFFAAPPLAGAAALPDYLLILPAEHADKFYPLGGGAALPAYTPAAGQPATPLQAGQVALALHSAWAEQISVGAGQAEPLARVLAACFDAVAATTAPADTNIIRYDEPAPLVIEHSVSLGSGDGEADTKALQGLQRGYERYRAARLRINRDLEILEGRAFVLAMLADGVAVQAAGVAAGAAPQALTATQGANAALARHLGTTLRCGLAQEELAELVRGGAVALRRLVRAQDGTPSYPAAPASRLANDPARRFSLAPPRFRQVAAPTLSPTGVHFRFQLYRLAPALDMQRDVMHYLLERQIDGGPAVLLTIKPSQLIGARPDPAGGGYEPVHVRLAVTLSDNLADLPEEQRKRLLDGSGGAHDIDYLLTPVCHAGSRGVGLRLSCAVRPAAAPLAAPLGITAGFVFDRLGAAAQASRAPAWSLLDEPAWRAYFAAVRKLEAPRLFLALPEALLAAVADAVEQQARAPRPEGELSLELIVRASATLPTGPYGDGGSAERASPLDVLAEPLPDDLRVLIPAARLLAPGCRVLPARLSYQQALESLLALGYDPAAVDQQATRQALAGAVWLAGAPSASDNAVPERVGALIGALCDPADGAAPRSCRLFARLLRGAAGAAQASSPLASAALMLRLRPAPRPAPRAAATERPAPAPAWTVLRPETIEWPVLAPLPPRGRLPGQSFGQAADLRAQAGRALIAKPLAAPPGAGAASLRAFLDGETVLAFAASERNAVRLAWSAQDRDPRRAALAGYVAGYQVMRADTDELGAADLVRLGGAGGPADIHPRVFAERGVMGPVRLVSAEAAAHSPADTRELAAFEAYYPSTSRIAGAGAGPEAALPGAELPWYSLAESELDWPAFEPRRRLFPEVDECLLEDLIGAGMPLKLCARLLVAPGTTAPGQPPNAAMLAAFQALLRHDAGTEPDAATAQWPLCWNVAGGGLARIRRIVHGLRLEPEADAASWGALLGLAPADWAAVSIEFVGLRLAGQELLAHGERSIALLPAAERPALARAPLALATRLHPLWVELLAEMRAPRDGHGRLDAALQEPPKTEADSLQGFLQATPAGRDPYGWGVLQSLGLAVVVALFEPERDAYLPSRQLLERVQLAWDAVAPHYPALAGYAVLEIVSRPGGLYSLAPHRAADYRSSGAAAMDDELQGFVQLSLRPRPRPLLHYWPVALAIDEQELARFEAVQIRLPADAALRADLLSEFGVAPADVDATRGASLTLRRSSLLARPGQTAANGRKIIPLLTVRSAACPPQLAAYLAQAQFCVASAPPAPSSGPGPAAPAAPGTAVAAELLLLPGPIAWDGAVRRTDVWSHPSFGAFPVHQPAQLAQLLAPDDAAPAAAFGGLCGLLRRSFAGAAADPGLAARLACGLPLKADDSAGRAARDRDVALYRDWSARFFRHGTAYPDLAPACATPAPGTAAPAAAAAAPPAARALPFALATAVHRNPWSLPAGGDQFLRLFFFEDSVHGSVRSYAVQPEGRYDAILRGAGYRIDPFCTPAQSCQPAPNAAAPAALAFPRVDVATPRTAPVLKPAVADSRTVTLSQADGSAQSMWQLALFRHPEEDAVQAGGTLAIRLAWEGTASRYARRFRWPDWRAQLDPGHAIFKDLNAVPQYPLRAAAEPAAAQLQPNVAARGDWHDELLAQAIVAQPDLWRGASLKRIAALPYHYEHVAVFASRAGRAKAGVTAARHADFTQAFDKIDGKLLRPQLSLRRGGAAATGAAALLEWDLVRIVDCLPAPVRALWTPQLADGDMSLLPEPDVVYEIIASSGAGAARIAETLAEVGRNGRRDEADRPWVLASRSPLATLDCMDMDWPTPLAAAPRLRLWLRRPNAAAPLFKILLPTAPTASQPCALRWGDVAALPQGAGGPLVLYGPARLELHRPPPLPAGTPPGDPAEQAWREFGAQLRGARASLRPLAERLGVLLGDAQETRPLKALLAQLDSLADGASGAEVALWWSGVAGAAGQTVTACQQIAGQPAPLDPPDPSSAVRWLAPAANDAVSLASAAMPLAGDVAELAEAIGHGDAGLAAALAGLLLPLRRRSLLGGYERLEIRAMRGRDAVVHALDLLQLDKQDHTEILP